MTKPISLIVANVMHNVSDEIGKLDDMINGVRKIIPGSAKFERPKSLNVDIARSLLCRIAHEARDDLVFKALEAVGAPASVEMIEEGLQAVKDAK